MNPKDAILRGETALGIEFGSTRIKGVLIDYDGNVLATGAYEWENSLIDGIWTYALSDAEKGLQACYSDLRQEVEEKYGIRPETFGAIGVSAMMHGYIALDKEDRQVPPLRQMPSRKRWISISLCAGPPPISIRECWTRKPTYPR